MGKIMHGNIVYGGGSEVRPNPSDAATTDLTKIKIDGITYSIPDGEVADVKVDNVSVVDGNGIANINTMTGADGSAAGTKGLVPAPASTDNTKFLRGDGTWQTVGGSSVSDLDDLNDVAISSATNGQVLKYNSGTWVNANDSGGDETIVCTMAQYNQYTPEQKADTTKTYYITDAPGGNNGINYSTSEQVIGTWIDGKPIYQITETLSNEVNITTSAYTGFTPSWIGDVEQFIDCKGYRVASNQYGTACHPLFARKSGANQLSLYSALSFNGVKYITFQFTKSASS